MVCGMFVSCSLCVSVCMLTVSNAFLMSSATVIVCSDGLFWLKRVAMVLFIVCSRFQRLPPARGGTAQRKIFHLANRSQLIHPGPSSSRSMFFYGVESVVRGNADSLLN